MSERDEAMFGWYSDQQARVAGVVEYERHDGTRVEVTNVTRDPLNHGCEWRDMEPRGPVSHRVGIVAEPTDPLMRRLRRNP